MGIVRRRFPQGGFTLIEMVVALFIVSVVMAIALPNLRVAGARAASTACEANERMIRAALTEYDLDYHHYPLDAGTDAILADLKNAGYLDTVPVCPGGGVYTITIQPGGAGADVTCSVHGELGNQ